jgi:hypothetical protein
MPAEQIQQTFDGMKEEEEQKRHEQMDRVRKLQEKRREVEALEGSAQKQDVIEGQFDWTRKYSVMEKWEVGCPHVDRPFENFAYSVGCRRAQ